MSVNSEMMAEFLPESRAAFIRWSTTQMDLTEDEAVALYECAFYVGRVSGTCEAMKMVAEKGFGEAIRSMSLLLEAEMVVLGDGT